MKNEQESPNILTENGYTRILNLKFLYCCVYDDDGGDDQRG
jgi:hypothetical protein